MMPVDLSLLDVPPVQPIADPKACPQVAMNCSASVHLQPRLTPRVASDRGEPLAATLRSPLSLVCT
jgi:hypothetical protein